MSSHHRDGFHARDFDIQPLRSKRATPPPQPSAPQPSRWQLILLPAVITTLVFAAFIAGYLVAGGR